MKKVILFGIGNIAENYINPSLINRVSYCVDNSKEKQGKEFLGKEIREPELLAQEEKNNLFILIFSQKYYKEIAKQLKVYGLLEGIHFISADEWKGDNEVPASYYQLEWETRVSNKGGYDNLFEEYKNIWDPRVQEMSKLISPESTSVMDIGCGNMNLKNYLPDYVQYNGIDYVLRDKNTIVCDFNKHEFTDKTADTFFISGCLEYIEDIEWFFKQFKKANREIILSYGSVDYIPNIFERMRLSWKNHMTIDSVIKGIEKQGFHLIYKYTREKELYTILKFIRHGDSI